VLYRNFASPEEIDAEYNMSLVVPDVAKYFESYVEQSARARETLTSILEVRFGPTVEETLDIFPAADPNAPILLFIHGGYWRRFSASEFSFVAQGLVPRGITVVVTNYALCPKVTIPEITRQSRAAVAWVRTTSHRFNGDRDRIFVAGHSAGGHLATRIVETDWVRDYGLPADTVKGACAISGLFDLRPVRYASVQASLQLTEDVIRAESPLFNIPATAPPLMAEVGANETSEFRRQSAEFIEAWRKAGLTGSCYEQAGRNHFTVVDELRDPDSAFCDRLVSLTGA